MYLGDNRFDRLSDKVERESVQSLWVEKHRCCQEEEEKEIRNKSDEIQLHFYICRKGGSREGMWRKRKMQESKGDLKRKSVKSSKR